MPSSAPAPIALDAEVAAFIQRNVSIVVASRGVDLTPAAVLACGCRVAADCTELIVFVNADQAADVLANLQATDDIAANFSQPSTHRTLQIKGRNVRLTSIQADDARVIADYRDSFVADLALIGFAEAYARAIIPAPNSRLTAIVFAPTQVFDQTPGLHAGRGLT